MFYKTSSFITINTLLALSTISLAKSPTWQIHNQWNSYYEQKYTEFVARLGEARAQGVCYTTHSCLKNRVANPMYVNQNPSSLHVRSDCADLPFVLRAYFAWANDLPFSYPSWPQLAPLYPDLQSKRSSDIRYSRNGNVITKRITIKGGENITQVINAINDHVSTASYRIRADRYDTGANYQDFYPVKISRDAIKPGTVVYDPSGHVAVVYKVEDDGRILLIDAHPDQSLTHITYGKKFSRSSLKINGGFKNWRPITLENGQIIPTPNKELPNYSLEQFIGNQTNDITTPLREAHYINNGIELDFYEYVRTMMFKGVLRYHPLQEIQNHITELCDDFKARVKSVQSAINHQIQLKPHPTKLPRNIYGTDGEWEIFSTPSRDARFKTLFVETFQDAQKFIQMYRSADPLLTYNGTDLTSDLKSIYQQQTQNCQATINLSSGKPYTLSLYQVGKHLFDLSFDPYHCIELRWGLVDLAQHTLACQSRNQFAWYKAERKLRNQIERNYSLNTAFDYQSLEQASIGREEPFIIDFEKLQ